jgi:thimet oligopeptidase
MLRAEKAKEMGTDLAATTLRNWDTSYYSEKVRRARYDVDQEKLRAYFPRTSRSTSCCSSPSASTA